MRETNRGTLKRRRNDVAPSCVLESAGARYRAVSTAQRTFPALELLRQAARRQCGSPRVRRLADIHMLLILLLSLGRMAGGQAPTLSPSQYGVTTPAETARPSTTRPTITRSPTRKPTISPKPTLTKAPTNRPTRDLALLPSGSPSTSAKPSGSSPPTGRPSRSVGPSSGPTRSRVPTLGPSARPTITPRPTISSQPSDIPSAVPSVRPTMLPTFWPPSIARQRYRQGFDVPNDTAFFNPEQIEQIDILFSGYTKQFAPDAVRVVTDCQVKTQQIVKPDANASDFINELDYKCVWNSTITNVTNYHELFLEFMNGNLANVTRDLQALGIETSQALPATETQIFTSMPTSSPRPTPPPSQSPSVTASPSTLPSDTPSFVPTFRIIATTKPSPKASTIQPTIGPTSTPTRAPTNVPSRAPSPPTTPGRSGLGVAGIAAITVTAGLVVLAGLVIYYRRLKKKRQAEFMARHNAGEARRKKDRVGQGAVYPDDYARPVARHLDADSQRVAAPMSPSESLISNKSLLSAGESGLDDDSGDEADGTKNLQDEFDQYKDQNLEQLRSDVEGNLTGFEGIMSAAMTRALIIGDDDTKIDPGELLWGCHGNPSGAEVEASALYEVNNWLQRNENSTIEEKRAFMQEILNKMVASVRHGVIQADEASRTIHESAALLSLSLANELPNTTVIISGMRKTVTSAHMLKALREFGEIDVAAVASGLRGFGIVRFRHPKSVDRAMRRFRSGEIVVQDVAVQIRVLTPSGTVERRAGGVV